LYLVFTTKPVVVHLKKNIELKTFKVILILIFISQNCSSQSDSIKFQSIDKKIYEIEKKRDKKIAEYTQQIDPITINVSKFNNRVNIINYFQNSKSTLNSNFYFDNGELIFISFVEKSTKLENDPEKSLQNFIVAVGN
jgi:hypothetical protein